MSVTVIDNGPIRVDDGQGSSAIVDMYGNVIAQAPCYLCRCGLSAKKPFCDGSHKQKFESIVSNAKE